MHIKRDSITKLNLAYGLDLFYFIFHHILRACWYMCPILAQL